MYNIRQWHPGSQPNKRAGARNLATAHAPKVNVRTARKQRQRQRGRRK
jgi:hypothetical protein